MAIDGANLINSNVVYDTSHSMNNYNKILQQQQLKAQAEQKALMDELGSVKSDGIRDADKQLFYDQFDKWRNAAIQANKEKDPYKKMIAQSDAEKEKMKAAQIVGDSKAYQKVRDQVATHYISKNPLDDFEEPSWNQWKESDKLSINDPRIIKDISSLQIIPDIDGFTKSISITNNDLLKTKGIYQNAKETRQKIGNQMGTMIEQVKTVDPKHQIDAYKISMLKPANYKAAQAMYPTLASQLPKEQFIEEVAKDLALKNPISVPNAPRYIMDKTPPKGSGSSEKDATTFRQQLISGILNNSKSHIDKLKAYLPSGSQVEYLTSKKIDGKSKGGYNLVRVHIPTQVDVSTGKATIGFDEDISLSKGDASNRLNSILNQYANKVSMDKLNIEGGKPRGEEVSIKGQAKQSKQSQGKKQPKQFVSKSGIKVTIE